MSKVVCSPANLIPKKLVDGTEYFSMFKNPGRYDVSTVGTGLLNNVQKSGICPNSLAWDFAVFSLAVSAADMSVSRSGSADGWTRTIELTVFLVDPKPYVDNTESLQEMLRFLTGDFWALTFRSGGVQPPKSTAPALFEADCVSLLSGGVDSLVGGIDLTKKGHKPLFLSHIAKGDSETQVLFAKRLNAAERHLQWNQNVHSVHSKEPSTRGRSLVFFALALLAATSLEKSSPVSIFVPENGFISLNVPLNAGRSGSLSTKTTHPVFMDRLQAIWNKLGFQANLVRLYAFKTKGELMAECLDQSLLAKLVGESTSCGRYGHYNYTHCGRCVPCMVRRASFLKAKLNDSTNYHFKDLTKAGSVSGPNDIGAVASAILRHEKLGVRNVAGGQLWFATLADRPNYEDVISRGFKELAVMFRKEGVL